jgi:hypothetical protein
MGKRVLVTGDRNWNNSDIIHHWLKEVKKFGFDTLIEGEARGADTLSRIEGAKLGFTILKFPANWDKYPKAAGPIRNTEMLKVGKPELVLAFHNDIKNSKGTKNMIDQAIKSKIKVILIDYKGVC